MTYWYVCATDM